MEDLPEDLKGFAVKTKEGSAEHYKCLKCGTLFFTLRDLAGHLVSAHGVMRARKYVD